MHASQMGIQLELYSVDLFDDLGRLNVKHDIRLIKKTKNGKIISQLDFAEGWPIRRYHECKFRSNNNYVTLEEVAKTVSVLKLHGINPRYGNIITNTDYLPRAKEYAHKVGLTLINREALVKLDWKRTHQLRSLVQGPTKEFDEQLEERVRNYKR